MSDEVDATQLALDTKMNTPVNSQQSQDPDEDVDDKVEAMKAELNAAAVEHFKLDVAAETYRSELLSKLESDRHHIVEGAYNKGADDGIKAGILMGLVAGGALLFVGWLAWNGLPSFSEPTDTSKRSNE
jgi:galactokinase/mevalonate kinase-like predicted kinase